MFVSLFCVTGELNQQVETFAGELRLKTEESSRQKEEMTALLAQLADLHKKIRQVSLETASCLFLLSFLSHKVEPPLPEKIKQNF